MLNDVRILPVVLHYGKPELTRRVAEALQAGNKAEVLVLDNAAPEPYPQALRLPKNVFWGGALEKALQLAREQGYSHLWFCNNDIRFVTPPPPPALVERVAGRLVYIHKILGRAVGIWTPSVSLSPYHPQMVQQADTQFASVTCVDGIAPLLNVACVDAIGGLDCADNIWGYGVDVWLSLRAHARGWPVVVDHQVLLRHKYHTTARSIPGFMEMTAVAQEAYMQARMGQDWRALLWDAQHHRTFY